MPTPSVAIIGRANVGKSSLFNAFIEEQKSLVSPVAGTTRDRFEADCIWRGQVIRVVDTGGLDTDRTQALEDSIVLQTHKAIEKADLLVFIVDLHVPPTSADLAIAKLIFSTKKPVVVLGNKADTPELRRRVNDVEWQRWPLSLPIPICVKQGIGLGDALDAIYATLTSAGFPPAPIASVLPMRVAVFGEPNVGKSTLLNALLGEERFIAADMPHTTREPNDVLIVRNERTYQFIDTAGVRKHASMMRSGENIERLGVERTLQVLERANVVLFVIDVTKEVSAQDRHLAGVLAQCGVSTIIIANKWDKIPHKTPTSINDHEKRIRAFLPQLDYAPIIFTSALEKLRTENVFTVIDHVFATRFTQLEDQEARSFISRAIMRHRPSRGKGVKHPKIISFLQEKTNPPRFALQVNLSRTDSLADSYLRFLENVLREQYDFSGTPIRIRVETARTKSHTTY